jgi:Trk-type K+ transport system membrane component
MISLRLYTVGLGTVGVAFASYALLRRKPKERG